jgi:hypothetical protein
MNVVKKLIWVIFFGRPRPLLPAISQKNMRSHSLRITSYWPMKLIRSRGVVRDLINYNIFSMLLNCLFQNLIISKIQKNMSAFYGRWRVRQCSVSQAGWIHLFIFNFYKFHFNIIFQFVFLETLSFRVSYGNILKISHLSDTCYILYLSHPPLIWSF